MHRPLCVEKIMIRRLVQNDEEQPERVVMIRVTYSKPPPSHPALRSVVFLHQVIGWSGS